MDYTHSQCTIDHTNTNTAYGWFCYYVAHLLKCCGMMYDNKTTHDAVDAAIRLSCEAETAHWAHEPEQLHNPIAKGYRNNERFTYGYMSDMQCAMISNHWFFRWFTSKDNSKIVVCLSYAERWEITQEAIDYWLERV